MKSIIRLSTLILAAALTACGGGGGDAPPLPSAEGIWGGTKSDGLATALFVLETGETWGFYGGGINAGVLHGNTTTASDNRISATIKDLNLILSQPKDSTFVGSFVPRRSMNITTSPGEATLAATYDDSYDVPADLAAVAGTYDADLLVTAQVPPPDVTLVVGNTGNLTAVLSPGCTAEGRLTLRPSGKAIMNLSLKFLGTGCVVPNGAEFAGVAQYSINTGLFGLGMNNGETLGLLLFANKLP